MKSITFLGNVTSIGAQAFLNCLSLTDFLVQESVKSIEAYAFKDCFSLREIIIPSQLTIIGDGAFSNCTNLKCIKFLNNSNIITMKSSIFLFNENPIDFFIPGNFNITISFWKQVPKGSNLFITRDTILSKSCKDYCGEKFVYVHFDDEPIISDATTKEVIQYISIKPLFHKTKLKCIYRKTNTIYFSPALACIKK